MNRRAFLGTLLGAGAAMALPSEVWPFRKIFLPSARWMGIDWGFGFDKSVVTVQGCVNENFNGQFAIYDKAIPDLYLHPDGQFAIRDKAVPDLYLHPEQAKALIELADVEAIELEAFEKQIPDLLTGESHVWNLLALRRHVDILAPMSAHEAVGLKPAPYPGRLSEPLRVPMRLRNGNSIEMPAREVDRGVELLHRPATLDNVMEFIDVVQKKANDL